MAVPVKLNFPRVGGQERIDNFYGFGKPVGTVRYVHSSGLAAGPGGSPETAFSTLQAAHDACTANNGDVVVICAGHAENIATAGGITLSKAGVTYIGLGTGTDRPTFTWSATDSTLAISGANTSITNVITKVSIDEVVSMILVTGAGVTLDRVDFRETASAQAIQWLLTTNAADHLTIKNCTHYQVNAAAAAQKWIQLVGPDYTRIIDNTFLLVGNASTSSHLISGSTAVVYCEIARNLMLFTGATITIVINLVTGSTGVISDNRLGSGTSVTTAAAITGDGCFMFANLWADTAAASGLLAPAVDTDT